MLKLHKQLINITSLICLCFLGTQFTANAQIVKVLLSGTNDCNGELQVGIYVRASLYSPMDFKIGSSSIFVNFDPSVVSFSTYTPIEFGDQGSGDGAWLDQKVTADNECGISNIVLQLQENGGQNLYLTKQSLLHVGTLNFDILMEGADPQVVLNQRFTEFNRAETNDGTQKITLENYPKVLEYNCLITCVEAPIVTNITMEPSACVNPTGSISVEFPAHPARAQIEFSLDGGFTYPFNFGANIGSATFSDLSSGYYDLWVRWGDDACPTKLSEVRITNVQGPTADFQGFLSCGENSDGQVTFTFPDHPSRTYVQFSIDGGFTFPYTVADNAGSFDVTGLPAGNYNTWVRWGATDCPTSLGFVTVEAEDYPELVALDYDICGLQTKGIIKLVFDDHPQYTNFEVSIDGGLTFPYTIADDINRFDIIDLEAGSYEIWSRWQNFSCTNFIGTKVISPDVAPVSSFTTIGSCYSETDGEIIFDFPDYSGRSHLQFSIDGGISFHTTLDTMGTFVFSDLSPGNYAAMVRWGNKECPSSLGNITVPVILGPDVYFHSKENSCSQSSTGSIRIGIADHPDHSSILVSLDGGTTFPHTVADDLGIYTFENLAAGSYHLKVKWDDGTCLRQIAQTVLLGQACATCDDGILNGTEEYIDCGGPDCMPCDMCPYSEITVSERPMPNFLSLRSGNWIKSDGMIGVYGNVSLKAANHIELMSGFEIMSGGQLLIGIEGCDNN